MRCSSCRTLANAATRPRALVLGKESALLPLPPHVHATRTTTPRRCATTKQSPSQDKAEGSKRKSKSLNRTSPIIGNQWYHHVCLMLILNSPLRGTLQRDRGAAPLQPCRLRDFESSAVLDAADTVPISTFKMSAPMLSNGLPPNMGQQPAQHRQPGPDLQQMMMVCLNQLTHMPAVFLTCSSQARKLPAETPNGTENSQRA